MDHDSYRRFAAGRKGRGNGLIFYLPGEATPVRLIGPGCRNRVMGGGPGQVLR